ncbi:hypothetical protein GF357_01170 [Candidatus Dojkabacteria bacterium]|nr:hypothetical protein [Candidatus Dojkabacteria bacterium]
MRRTICIASDNRERMVGVYQLLVGGNYELSTIRMKDVRKAKVPDEGLLIIINDNILALEQVFSNLKSCCIQPKTLVISREPTRKLEKRFLELTVSELMFYPYCPIELTWRIKKIFGKSGNIGRKPKIIRYKSSFAIDAARCHLFIGDYTVKITKLERCLLMNFIKNNGFLSKDDLCRCLREWKNRHIDSRYLTVIISRLRRKVKCRTGFSLIRSRYGVGYSLIDHYN